MSEEQYFLMSGKHPWAKFSSLLMITIYTCNSRRGPSILRLDFSVRLSLSRQTVHICRTDENSATLRFFLLPSCRQRGILGLIGFNKPHCTAIIGGLLLSPTHMGRRPLAALHILNVNRKRPHRSPRSPASFWLFGAPL